MENKENLDLQPQGGEQSVKKKANRATVISLVIIVVTIVFCLGYIGVVVWQNTSAERSYDKLNEVINNVDEDNGGEEEQPVDESAVGSSPVDLPALTKINSDVYAWIRIPGTYVDYPIAQSTVEDNYYLHRSIYKRYLFAGMIYSQSVNKTDFSDPVTVIYGHNMRNKTMFGSLHSFEDKDFFEQHDVFYIYTKDRVLTYKIVSAYKYDNRHIMNAFDFTDSETLENYQNYVLNPTSTLRNVREGVSLTEDSKLVVLSTCMGNDKKSRFLVNGVLVSDVAIEQEQ